MLSAAPGGCPVSARQYVIVVADDDPLMNLVLREMLSYAGYQVLCCFSGGEAEQVIRRVIPDIAIVDMQMEVQDAGMRLLASLRQDPSTAALSVVICSADVLYLDTCREDLAGYGAEVVAKPFALDYLLETVRRMLPAEVGG
jgi:CheY-like chemotaxis protein